MRVFSQAIVFVVSLLFGDSFIRAQVVSDPSGHWEGSITMPFGELRFELDLAPDAHGKWSGTLGVPDQKLKGFPLSSVTIDGTSVTFAVRGGQGGTFRGSLSADGRSMAGSVSSPEGEAPFTLERTGDANIVGPPRSAKISQSARGNLERHARRERRDARDPAVGEPARWHLQRIARQRGRRQSGDRGRHRGRRRQGAVQVTDDRQLVRGDVQRVENRAGRHVYDISGGGAAAYVATGVAFRFALFAVRKRHRFPANGEQRTANSEKRLRARHGVSARVIVTAGALQL